ncbi:MAG: response regulator [Elusimicrobiota bacterium]|nr:response regulator [Elusimicrobiota bacterium]
MEKNKTAILIVDDDNSMSGFLSRALESRGFAVTPARSAEEFLDKVLLEPFELALIDVNLPGMDGITLTKEIKARAGTCDIIIMTGDPNLENAIGAIKAGAYDFLIKPFSDEMLNLTVERCLQKRKLSLELTNTKTARDEILAAYSQLQSLEKMKDAFLSVIGHELKTPLTKILSGLEIIKDSGAAGAPEAIINAAQTGALRLQDIINDILAYTASKNSVCPALPSAADAADLIKKAVEELAPVFKAHNASALTSFPETAPTINCEPERLTVAIKHLIKNAVTFGPPGGVVKITLVENAGGIRLSVEDAGIGIPAEKLNAIYDPFYQVADYMTRKSGGLGLGLALVKQIAETCKGKIEVKSAINKGTTFTLVFPNKKNQCPAPPRPR